MPLNTFDRINYGWLNDYGGYKFAPATFYDLIYTTDGQKFKEKLENDNGDLVVNKAKHLYDSINNRNYETNADKPVYFHNGVPVICPGPINIDLNGSVNKLNTDPSGSTIIRGDNIHGNTITAGTLTATGNITANGNLIGELNKTLNIHGQNFNNLEDVTIDVTPTRWGGTGNVNGRIQVGQVADISASATATSEGTNTNAFAENSHASGANTIAGGISSFAMGTSTAALGENSVAEGILTTAYGPGSHSSGIGTVDAGTFTTVLGGLTSINFDNIINYITLDLDTTSTNKYNRTNFAFGNASFTQGENTLALGIASSAFGFGSVAVTNAQTVIGRGNKIDLNNSYAFIVGNGDISNVENEPGKISGTLSNALTLDWEGRLSTSSNHIIRHSIDKGEIPDVPVGSTIGRALHFLGKTEYTDQNGVLDSASLRFGSVRNMLEVVTGDAEQNNLRNIMYLTSFKPSAPDDGEANPESRWHADLYVYTTYDGYCEAGVSSSGGLMAQGEETTLSSGNIVFMGAAWNDYAEFRDQVENIEPGYCVASADDGKVYKTSEKFQACDGIVSDTYGFAIGRSETYQTPLAVSGRVLAYCEGNRYDYHAGDTVCAGSEGKVCKMTREEIKEYPDRIIGIVSEIPEYEEWTGKKVNNRIWIKVK